MGAGEVTGLGAGVVTGLGSNEVWLCPGVKGIRRGVTVSLGKHSMDSVCPNVKVLCRIRFGRSGSPSSARASPGTNTPAARGSWWTGPPAPQYIISRMHDKFIDNNKNQLAANTQCCLSRPGVRGSTPTLAPSWAWSAWIWARVAWAMEIYNIKMICMTLT